MRGGGAAGRLPLTSMLQPGFDARRTLASGPRDPLHLCRGGAAQITAVNRFDVDVCHCFLVCNQFAF